jgi:hypothetical protein
MERRITSDQLIKNFKGTKWEQTMSDIKPIIDSNPEIMYRRKYDIDGKAFMNFYLYWCHLRNDKLGSYKTSSFRNFVYILTKQSNKDDLPRISHIKDLHTPTVSAAWSHKLVDNKNEFFRLIKEQLTDDVLHSYIAYIGNDDFAAWCVLSRIFNETARAGIYRKVTGLSKATYATKPKLK